MAPFTQKMDFLGKKFLSHFKLLVIAEAVKHQFLINAGKDFRTERLFGAREHVTFEGCFRGMLKHEQFSRADI